MSARDQLRSISFDIELQSIDATLKATELLRRSAKLEQLADLMTEEQAERCIANMLKDGLVKVVNGVITIVDEVPTPSFMTAGGDA